ncbi:hypothetical protein SCE1572_41270 [Sorangium cellulosum So0157-2]|uniref:Uncharacterized protein n=1 Tax=Sorangium cellulosum So0157-2 TaxID=1254432 RepID=S4Y7Z5_SORCE|nr:hypothetical protein SCE1572_41270 [Sorangium cellulosum So0157-2]
MERGSLTARHPVLLHQVQEYRTRLRVARRSLVLSRLTADAWAGSGESSCHIGRSLTQRPRRPSSVAQIYLAA